MSSFSPPSKPALFPSSSPSPPSPPPSVTSAQEDAFRSSQSRVLLVCGVPPDCGNQQDLLGWLSSRAAAGGRSSGGSLGVIGVFRHATEQAGTTSEADWWVVFREHELAWDALRDITTAGQKISDTTNLGAVKVQPALEENLAPLEKLVQMPLVAGSHTETFPTFAPPSSTPASTEETYPSSAQHDRTPSLSFSSTSSSSVSTHGQSSPASRPPDLLQSTKFHPDAKPFFPESHVWSSVEHDSQPGRPEMNSRSQSYQGYATGGAHESTANWECLSGLEMSTLGLTGTGGVSFRQGDWICPSDTCSFHNFSRNDQCIICATAKPVSTSSRAAPRPDLAAPTPQRFTGAIGTRPPQKNVVSPTTPQPPSQNTGGANQQQTYHVAGSPGHAYPPHLTRSSPTTYHNLPNRPLLNSVSLPDFQGAGSASERMRKVSTLSSPGVQLAPLPRQSPGYAAWRDQSATPSPVAHRGPVGSSYFGSNASPNLSGLGYFGSGDGTVRGRSLTFAGGSGAADLAQSLVGLGISHDGFPGGGGHRATLSLGSAAPERLERFAPIVNSGNTGPMTIQQGDWACGTCGFVNWRRRKVCLKCFPLADGNELPGFNLAASALLAAQLAQAHTTPTPTPTSSPASAYQSSPLRGPSHLAAPPPTNNRTFISSGPYRPPPPPQGQTATPPNSGQLDQARNFDVFGLVSPGQPAVPQQLANVDSSVGGSTNGAQGRGRDVPSLSPIGSEVRSFASTTTTTQQGPRRPTQLTHRSSSHLRDVLHQRQASEGLLGLNTHSTASVGSNLAKNGAVKDQ